MTTSITLPLRLSTVLASAQTQDARDIDASRSEMRALARKVLKEDPSVTTVDVYACERHGGCQLQQYTREDLRFVLSR